MFYSWIIQIWSLGNNTTTVTPTLHACNALHHCTDISIYNMYTDTRARAFVSVVIGKIRSGKSISGLVLTMNNLLPILSALFTLYKYYSWNEVKKYSGIKKKNHCSKERIVYIRYRKKLKFLSVFWELEFFSPAMLLTIYHTIFTGYRYLPHDVTI